MRASRDVIAAMLADENRRSLLSFSCWFTRSLSFLFCYCFLMACLHEAWGNPNRWCKSPIHRRLDFTLDRGVTSVDELPCLLSWADDTRFNVLQHLLLENVEQCCTNVLNGIELVSIFVQQHSTCWIAYFNIQHEGRYDVVIFYSPSCLIYVLLPSLVLETWIWKAMALILHARIDCRKRYRGYYMAAQRYEISLRVLKNILRVSAANEWNMCQHDKLKPQRHISKKIWKSVWWILVGQLRLLF